MFQVEFRLEMSLSHYGCEPLAVVSRSNSKNEPTEFTAYVRNEGKITVPKEVRDLLNIERGDLVRCKIVKVKMQ